MALADLKNVLNIFGGSDIGEDKQNELFKEVLLMTLARAAMGSFSGSMGCRGDFDLVLFLIFFGDAMVRCLQF